VRADKSISPSFLFATLLWLQVRTRWKARLQAGEHAFPALHTAIDSVLDEQAEKLAIQRRYQSDMREIWVMQPRLEKRGKTAFHLLEHMRFRAGYDFLLLRCESGEVPAEVGEWWTRFIDAATPEREELIRSLAPQAGPANKRRRRRSGPKPAGEGDPAATAAAPDPVAPGTSQASQTPGTSQASQAPGALQASQAPRPSQPSRASPASPAARSAADSTIQVTQGLPSRDRDDAA